MVSPFLQAGWDWTELRDASVREARRHLGSAEAEDVAHDALVRAWNSRRACRTPHDPVPWLRTIVRREAARHHARRREVPVAEPDPGAGPAPDALESLPERLDVRAAVRALAPADRAMVLLRYGADMTQPQVAQVVGAPEGTVKVRLHRARIRLRGTLTP